MGGVVEVNVTFYLVETSISMNAQRPVAIGADEVNTGASNGELAVDIVYCNDFQLVE